jgi:para-nitrobenzyl esterase
MTRCRSGFGSCNGRGYRAGSHRLPLLSVCGGYSRENSHRGRRPKRLSPAGPLRCLPQQNDVPVLIGSNAEEGRSVVDVSKVKAATFAADLAAAFGPLPPALIAAYPYESEAEARQARLDLERDLRFGWDMWAWARLQATTGRSSVYYYSFQQRPPFPKESVYADWGASHYAELWYVFDHLDQYSWAWTSADRTLAAEISTYWANFAKSGNPNGAGVPPWPAFESSTSRVQYLRNPITTDGVFGIEKLKVFDAIYSGARGKPFGSP